MKRTIRIELWPAGAGNKPFSSLREAETDAFREMGDELAEKTGELTWPAASGEILLHLRSIPRSLVNDFLRIS